MKLPTRPTPEQEAAALQVAFDLTRMFLSIHLVRFDERIGCVYIMAGRDIGVLIPPNGQWRHEE
jgi:hypothetical protein